MIGYPRDFHVSYGRFNGFFSNVFYSFQNLGKALQTLLLKRNSQKTFLIPKLVIDTISNGNRTEWSPIRSVIIRVINKIGRPRSGSPICLSRI